MRKNLRKKFILAKEVALLSRCNATLSSKCCERSEGSAKEEKRLSIKRIYIYLLLSLLSHALPHNFFCVLGGRCERLSPSAILAYPVLLAVMQNTSAILARPLWPITKFA
jgi:hypothetical protein